MARPFMRVGATAAALREEALWSRAGRFDHFCLDSRRNWRLESATRYNCCEEHEVEGQETDAPTRSSPVKQKISAGGTDFRPSPSPAHNFRHAIPDDSHHTSGRNSGSQKLWLSKGDLLVELGAIGLVGRKMLSDFTCTFHAPLGRPLHTCTHRSTLITMADAKRRKSLGLVDHLQRTPSLAHVAPSTIHQRACKG